MTELDGVKKEVKYIKWLVISLIPVFLISLTVSAWSMSESRSASAEVQAMSIRDSTTRGELESIKTDINWIKQTLSRIENKL